jgi:ABC-2 type transport system permease protein
MQNRRKYLRFSIYLIIIVLVNMAGATVFFRKDLTWDGIYSLSPESKNVVSTLTEPLTIKAFFTKNLPAPYNASEQYLRDLLEEYAIQGNRNFNYTIYEVSPQDTDPAGKGSKLRELAESYGIMPVPIQDVEKDEVKFKQAFMGLVILHGDMVEKIPAIISTDQLEYDLTTAILKLNNKISALIRLQDKVAVTLYMSPSLGPIGPLMGIRDLNRLPATLEETVRKISARSYSKITFSLVSPGEGSPLDEIARKYDLTMIKWPAVPEKQIASGEGVIGLVMAYNGKVKKLPILQVVQVPLLGESYKLEEPNKIEEDIDKGMESLVGINSDIGYVTGHGTFASSPYSPAGGTDTIGIFTSMLERNYTLREISPDKEPISAALATLIIARPTQKFSDYELLQIDQALMRGTNLIIYTDAFKEDTSQAAKALAGVQGPQFIPVDTGLEKLLEFYGVKIKKSIVMDENCFKQQDPDGNGEMPLYFIPIIKNNGINKDVSFLSGIKGLAAILASPLELNQDALQKNGIVATRLLSSSERSWEMKDHLTLNPKLIRPPQRADEKGGFALAYLLEGEFHSYFAGKPLPEMDDPAKSRKQNNQEAQEGKGDSEAGSSTPAPPSIAGISASGNFIAKGKKSKIFVMAASSMLRDNLLGPDGPPTNATFVMNVIDSFNNREGIAAMRSKKQSFNPLAEISVREKSFVKYFTIVGLPILAALFGLLVWGLRVQRKKAIQKMFAPDEQRNSI